MTLFTPIARLFRNRAFDIGFTTLVLVSLASYMLAGVVITPFHADEATQIAMSRDYWALAAGDVEPLLYSARPADPAAQELRLINGPLNPLLIGAVLAANGYSPDALPRPWDWGADIAYNVSVGARPPEALLNLARMPSAVLFALGLLPMYGLGWLVGQRPGALVAIFLYALHPALLVNGRRAMMEGGLAAFTLLTIWAAAWFVGASGKGKRGAEVAAGLMGISAGLALATKHTALFAVIAAYLMALVIVLARRRPRPADSDEASLALPALPRRRGRLLAALGLSAVLALGIFYALNPAWWGDPFIRAAEVLSLRQSLLAGQASAFGGYTHAGDAIAGWLSQAFVPPAIYFEVPSWESYLGPEIARYEASVFDGLRDLQAAGLQDVLFDFMVPLMALAGLVVLLSRWRRAPSNAESTKPSQRVILGSWAVMTLLFTLLLTPLPWQRYYLPMHLVTVVVVAAGMAWSLSPQPPKRAPVTGPPPP